jgi:hypothetical protein
MNELEGEEEKEFQHDDQSYGESVSTIRRLKRGIAEGQAVDISEWRLESERVSAQLVAHSKTLIRVGDGWQTHFTALEDSAEKLFSSATREGAGGGEILQALLEVSKDLKDSNRRLAQQEIFLNSRENLKVFSSEFMSFREVLRLIHFTVLCSNYMKVSGYIRRKIDFNWSEYDGQIK